MRELNLNRVPPGEEPPVVEPSRVEGQVVEQKTEQLIKPEEIKEQIKTDDSQVAEHAKDEFIENLNKRYNTQYKTDDDVKKLFEYPKKISEYEGRLSEFEGLKKTLGEKDKEIEELRGSQDDPLKYFSSPESYVAEQLKIKYPNRDSAMLHEIITTDIDKLNDFDLLLKAERLFNRNLPEGGRHVKDVLYKRYGIDAETTPEEWDGATKTQIAMDANVKREQIERLKEEIIPPKVVTADERQRLEAEALGKRAQALQGVKNEFTKFDKLKIGDFEYVLPDDYKSRSGDFFDGFFIEAANEMNEENLRTAIEMRNALCLHENFEKIKEVIVKQAIAEEKGRVDAELHNDVPPNTATRTDELSEEKPQGISELIRGLSGR